MKPELFKHWKIRSYTVYDKRILTPSYSCGFREDSASQIALISGYRESKHKSFYLLKSDRNDKSVFIFNMFVSIRCRLDLNLLLFFLILVSYLI